MKFLFVKIFIVASLLFLVESSKAQISVIPQAGLNLSTFSFTSENYSQTTNAGYQVGVQARFGKNAYLQTGALWSQLSNQIIYEDSLIRNSGTLVVKNILVPVLLGFNIYDADIFKIRLQAGINLNFPVTIDDNVFDIKKTDFKGSNIGAAVGFGVDIFRFVMDINFSFGINDMMTVSEVNVNLKQYSLSLGYLINNDY
jgi:hypothetical protein